MTSQPSPDEFIKVFKKHKEQGNDVIYIGISSYSSGTLQSAKIAKQLLDYDRIYIIDSMQLSHGLEVLIRLACNLRDMGESAMNVAERIKAAVPKVRFLTFVNNLKYLSRGGRVKRFSEHDGGKQNMKTLVTMSDGKFSPFDVARGRYGAFEKMHSIMHRHSVDEMFPVVLTHADNREDMHRFEKFLKTKGMIYNYSYSQIGRVIGSHMSPGTVGIAYIEK